MKHQPMKTIGGMSVRAEIEARLETKRAETIDEVINFLGGSGFVDAAEALRTAAYAPKGESHG